LDRRSVEHFHSLDALRGIAALGVLFWHWQHFFIPYADVQDYQAWQFPLYGIFSPFYEKGWMAVDLFFGLSGFVFFWMYSGRIRSGEVGPGRFALLRISRLWPLHLATLSLVMGFQCLYWRLTGEAFIYQFADLPRFLLNLFLLPSWRMVEGHPCFLFNGPAWSISVEIALYALFYAFARFMRPRAPAVVALAVLGFAVEETLDESFGRGIGSFFLGGAVFLAYRAFRRRPRGRLAHLAPAFAALAGWSLVLAVHKGFLSGVPVPDPGAYRSLSTMDLLQDAVLAVLPRYLVVLLVFPLTVFALAVWEERIGRVARKLSFLGDISYSSYLLHFPLQLVVSTFVAWRGVDCKIFFSDWFLLGFLALLVGASLASHRFLEMPAQRMLRSLGSARAGGRGSALLLDPVGKVPQSVDSALGEELLQVREDLEGLGSRQVAGVLDHGAASRVQHDQ
jgi:peptidoglycan/LPS O-acetylase OafA/YrhL